ncbi:MAG: FtsX-like permease family protein [Brevinematia bacterium]
MLLKIAIRSIFRHKRRNALIVITIIIGTSVYITMDSLYNGIDRMFVEGVVDFSDSSIVVYPEDYDKNRRGFPVNKGVKDFNCIDEVIREKFKYLETTYRTQFLCEVIFGAKSKYVTGIAVDPERDKRVFRVSEKVKGEYLGNKGEILIGGFLAKSLGINVGEYVTVSARTVDGTYNAIDFRVVGVIETGNVLVDESGIIMSYSSANDLLSLRDLKTSFHIKVEWHKGESLSSYVERVKRIASVLEPQLTGYKVYTFADLHGYFLELMRQGGVDHYFLMAIILIIAGVGIANGVLMSIYERVKEIGILMAMGMHPKQIRALFVLEGLIVGIVGGIVGLFTGGMLNILLVSYGFDFSIFGGSGKEWGMPVWGVIYGVWNVWGFVVSFSFVFLVSLISAYLSSRHISKFKVIDCLRFV